MKFITPLLFVSLSSVLPGAISQISNGDLTLRFDDQTHRFSLVEEGHDKPFVTDGKLSGTPANVAEKKTADPVFGPGKSLVVTFAEGGTASLELYSGLPFALIRETRTNTTPAEIDAQKVVPATVTIDLGQPASALATMGTGGLLAPDKNPGSYELRIRIPNGWVLDRALAMRTGLTGSRESVTGTATTAPGIARLTLTSPAHTQVAWNVSFKPGHLTTRAGREGGDSDFAAPCSRGAGMLPAVLLLLGKMYSDFTLEP
jgi:hypothetical protein